MSECREPRATRTVCACEQVCGPCDGEEMQGRSGEMAGEVEVTGAPEGDGVPSPPPSPPASDAGGDVCDERRALEAVQ